MSAGPRPLHETATGVRIEPAVAADLPSVLGLLERAHLPAAGVEACLPTALVARSGGAVVGAAALEPYGPAALLRSVVVDEALRGTGVGSRLVAAAVGLARDRGIGELYLLTETAGAFFATLGWTQIPRDVVPDPVQTSAEFAGLCPASAVAMRFRLETGEPA